MSLLERVEAARLERERTAAGIPPGTPPPSPPPSTPPPSQADASSAVVPAAEPAKPQAPAPEQKVAPRRLTSREETYRAIKARVEAEVVDALASSIDLSKPVQVRGELTGQVDEFVKDFLADNDLSLSRAERERLISGVVDEVAGFGPIEPMLSDSSVTEVMVNGPHQIFIERAGKLIRTDVSFRDDEHVLNVIDRIISPLGRHIDETSPRVDARLPDGSRVNAIIEPLSLIGPVITVRKFATRYTTDDLIGFGTATGEMFDFLQACVEARLNVFLSGGTGSGKTTTLNVLSSFIPEEERIITIEDAAELQLSQRHVVTLEARPANLEGQGEITIRDLLRNALHMRPDRIVVGECRAGEALDMIQAMTTGQEGSLSTGHANTPQDMLRRLETMILMTGYELPMRAIREQIASAVDVIVHTARLKDGTRKIVSITEVFGIEDDDILTQEIFRYEQTGVVDGKIQGYLKPTGIRPTFMNAFIVRGIKLPEGEYGIPPEDPNGPPVRGKTRLGFKENPLGNAPLEKGVGEGRAVTAGGMAYISAVGPVNRETGQVETNDIRKQTRQAMQNLKEKLEEAGSSLDQVVWANWSLRETSDFDSFYEGWLRWFPEGAAPMGQGTLLPTSHRRAGFRVSVGVIAAIGPSQAASDTMALPTQRGEGVIVPPAPDVSADAETTTAPSVQPSETPTPAGSEQTIQ